MCTGPPIVAPNWLERPGVCSGVPGAIFPEASPSLYCRREKCWVAFQRCCQCWSYSEPWNLLVPALVITLTVAPEVWPTEASKSVVPILNSTTASEGGTNPTRRPVPVTTAPSIAYSFWPTPPAVLNAEGPPL